MRETRGSSRGFAFRAFALTGMIESASNPTVRLLQSLASAKGRREHGLFLAEGVRLINDALAAGKRPEICLYHEESLRRTERGKSLLRRLAELGARRDAGTSVQPASERAIAAAAGTQHPQGVVAAFKIPQQAPEPRAEGVPLVLVCDNVQDPGNLGTILRTAEAAGACAVLLSREAADPYNPKVVRAAMGAHFRLPVFPDLAWEQVSAALGVLGVPETAVFATDAGARLVYDAVDWRGPAALIVSNEAHGLTPEAASLAERSGGLVAIPMQGSAESLNAAIAAAVVLFEAARQRRTGTPRS